MVVVVRTWWVGVVLCRLCAWGIWVWGVSVKQRVSTSNPSPHRAATRDARVHPTQHAQPHTQQGKGYTVSSDV
jgi:hypothetical protein